MWYVHYKLGGAAGLFAASTLPNAFKRACELIDQGTEVSRIEGTGGLLGVNVDEIRLAYIERAKRKTKKNGAQ